MSEIDIIEKLSPQERELYEKIASIHRDRRIEALKEEIKQALLQRNFITSFASDTYLLVLHKLAMSYLKKFIQKFCRFHLTIIDLTGQMLRKTVENLQEHCCWMISTMTRFKLCRLANRIEPMQVCAQ